MININQTLILVFLILASGCIDDPLYIFSAKGVSSVEQYMDPSSIWTYESDVTFDHIHTMFYDGEDYVASNFIVIDNQIYAATNRILRCLYTNGVLLWEHEIQDFKGPNMLHSGNEVWLSNGQTLSALNGDIVTQTEAENAWVTRSRNYISWSGSEIILFDKNTKNYSTYGSNFSLHEVPHPERELYFTSKGNVLFCLNIDQMKN